MIGVTFSPIVQHDKGECNGAGLAGKTDLEQARADMIIYCMDDTKNPMSNYVFEADEVKKVRTDDQTLLLS